MRSRSVVQLGYRGPTRCECEAEFHSAIDARFNVRCDSREPGLTRPKKTLGMPQLFCARSERSGFLAEWNSAPHWHLPQRRLSDT